MSIKTLAGISAAAILSILAGKAYAADVYAHLPFEGNGNNTVEGSPIGVGGEGSTAANNYITVRGGDEKENKAIVTTASVHPHANGASVFGTGDGTTMTLVASIQTIATQNATMMMIGNSNTPNVLGLFSDGTSGVYVGEITGDSITRLITASLDTATTKLHHYALAYDKGETKSVALYIDGVKVVDSEAVAPTVEPAGSWQLGAPYGGAKRGALVAPGTVVEDFQTFTSILTDEEVAALAADFPSSTTAPILSQFAPEAGETTWAAMTGGATLGNTVEITLSGDTTITMGDTVAIANLVIKGTGNLIIPDRENISWGSLTTTGWPDRIMTTKVLDGNGVTVPANTTVIINGSKGEAEPIAAGAVTVPAGAGLITHGNIAMTLTNNGTVDIADGVVNVTRGGQQAIKGTVNIASGAVFNNESDDSVAWSGGTTINVRGTLNMGDHRWTVGGSSTLNLFGGCTVTGRTSGDGSIDLYRSNNVITVAKGADDSITDVVLNAKIRVRNDDARISIANGMTLGITGGIGMSAGEGIGLSIVGGGKLAGTIPLMGVSVNLGSTNGQVAKFVASSGSNTLKWTGGQANNICSTDTKDDPFITINSGATLTIWGHDFSGWNGALTDHGWVKNNGNLVFADGDGSRFWREHIVFGNNSTMTINNGGRALLMYGGAGTANACQFMLPSGSATIKAGEGDQAGNKAVMFFGNDGEGGWGEKATGFSVGNGATLTVSCPIQGAQAIAKHGVGTLVFSNAESTYSGTITLNDGSVTVPKEFTGTVTAATGLECRTTEDETTTTYAIIHKVTLKLPTIEHTKIQYQYMTTGAEWVDVTATEGEYTLVVVEEKTGFNFRYVSEDEAKWTVSGNQSGYKYSSGLTSDSTYDAPKTGIAVTPATVTIAIPAAPTGTAVTVTAGGEEITPVDGSITVAPGTSVVVTYSATDAYKMEDKVFNLTAGSEGSIDVSTVVPTAKVNYTITVEVENATVAGLPGSMTVREDNATISFTVTPDEGYVVTEVKIGETTLTAADGTYTTTLEGDATITVTTEIDVPPEPIATVTEADKGELDAAYTFTINDSETAATSAYYADWLADFEVTFDRAIETDTVRLAGKYTVPDGMDVGYDGSWIGFELGSYDPESDEPIKLVGQFGLDLTYAMVRQIGEFGCGVKNLKGNDGTKMTVKLILINPDDEEDVLDISTTVYTLEAPKATDLPGAEEVPANEKTAYNEWAAANGVTESTTTDAKVLATAYAMGVTIGEHSSIEEAAKQAVEDEVPAIDMAELVSGDLEAAVAAIQDKYPNATVSLKDVTTDVTGEGATNTHLYKLVIELK